MMTNQLDTGVQVMPDFSMSPWYSDIECVAKFIGSCRVKQNKSKASEVEICQVLYPKPIPLLERSWWCFNKLPFGERRSANYEGISQRGLWGESLMERDN